MRRRTVVISALAATGVVLVVGVVFVATGAYNVAATATHTPFVRWLLNTTQERSVAARARGMPAPPPADAALVRHGFEHYHEMCATCHGAPGMERSEIGRGMNPRPPDLAESAIAWTDRELFWITKHGIKLAGMPAFGITHSDDELWGIVAFLRQLQDMSPGEYRRLASEVAARGDMPGTDHAHAAASGHPEGAAPSDEHLPGMDHAAGAAPPAATASHRMPEMDHHAMPQPGGVADRPAATPPADAGATEKLKALVFELLRDEFVRDRISSDSSLRRRWENEAVRKLLIGPAQSPHLH